VAAGNHVTFTDREVLPVPFTLDGLVYNGAEFGFYRVPGRDMVLAGYTIDVRLPSSSRGLVMYAQLATGEGDLVPGTLLPLHGVTARRELPLSPGLLWPQNTTWKVVITAEGAEDADMPQGLVLTYLLRYANGSPALAASSTRFRQEGVGFDVIGDRINSDGGPGAVLPPTGPIPSSDSLYRRGGSNGYDEYWFPEENRWRTLYQTIRDGFPVFVWGDPVVGEVAAVDPDVPEGELLFGAGSGQQIQSAAALTWLNAKLSVTGQVEATGRMTGSNFAGGHAATGGVSGAVTIDMTGPAYQTLTLTGDVTTIATSNRAAGRTVTVRFVGSGADRSLSGSWPSWSFLGTAPGATLAVSGKCGILSLTCFGAAETDVVAAYVAQA
jgi:hypothetical protein